MDALIFLLPILLLVFLVMRGRKQQRSVSDLQSSLAPGQRVMTTAGLHATVVEVTDSTVVLEVDDGVHTTWARAAVARRLEEPVDPFHAGGADAAADPAAAPTSEPTSEPVAEPTAEAPERAAERPER